MSSDGEENSSAKITQHEEKKVSDILNALKQEWEVQDECGCNPNDEDGQNFFSTYGESYLCGGESEAQFTDRVALAVWKANGGYCHIQVEAVYLEELPYEIHLRDQDAYYQLMALEERE